jgi:hypothetical protein
VDFDSDIGSTAAAAGVRLTTDITDQLKMVREEVTRGADALEIIDRAKTQGGVKGRVKAASAGIEKVMGKSGKGLGRTVLRMAADKLDKEVQSRGGEGVSIGDKERREALKKSIMEATGVGEAEANAQVTELYKDRAAVKEFETQVTHFAQRDSRDKSTWGTAQEGNIRKSTWAQITEATTKREEQFDEEIENLEDTLDVDSTFGIYSDEEGQIQKLATSEGGKRFAAKAAYARAFMGDPDDRDPSAWLALKKSGAVEGIDEATLEAELQGMDQDTVDRLGDMAGRGTGEQLTRYADSLLGRGKQGAYASKEFLGKFGKYSEKLEGFVAVGDQKLSARSIAEQFTDEELDTMAKTGGQSGKRFSKLFKAAKGGDLKAQGLLDKYVAEQQTTTKEGVDEDVSVKGSGERARKLEASEDALENVSAMFKDFSPAAKDFKEGASMFRDAMEAGQIMAREE